MVKKLKSKKISRMKVVCTDSKRNEKLRDIIKRRELKKMEFNQTFADRIVMIKHDRLKDFFELAESTRVTKEEYDEIKELTKNVIQHKRRRRF
jgi:hypothetical protein